MTILEQSRHKTTSLVVRVTKMDVDKITIRVWEKTGKTKGKMRAKWVVELKKNWTEMGITVERNEVERNKYPPIIETMTEEDTETG